MYRHRRHASQRRRTSAVQSGLAVKLAIGKVIACWQHLFIGKPTRNRILHQLELDACSTGFSRNRILPAKAGTTNGLRSLMQNPMTLRVMMTHRNLDPPRFRLESGIGLSV